ncbi:M15 family metallopeptidase [Demequina zhanjiangensis]|uniref:D-alanyl-D-alanine carboxypeptidase family protein n=1 Tax=Demequina zhanjiangensis TaxID=3051659 RepID=A0ABT8G4P4_9MICO|nr:D-alanyl-D-alanine carboxypeptidase family protein [Demequina sp. SYSU T00b26]MDN4474027.1 D-alanyl-D-alanine carboxypeptidase family protein [Demequina sp. SYSU T00b26]
MKFTTSRLRYLAAASIVASVGAGAGAAGAHAATVEVALHQAREAARAVEDKRDGLAASIERAQSATIVAEAHLGEDSVSTAVGQLDSTITAAASTAESLDVVVDIPEIVATPPLVEPTAEAPSPLSVDPSAEEAADGDPGDQEETAEEPVIQNEEVQKVLDREPVGLDAVRAATEELEATAAALDEAAAEVHRAAKDVDDATARAVLADTVDTLHADVIAANSQLADTFDSLATVGDRVMDPLTIESATDARDNLKAALASSVELDDLRSVRTLVSQISDAKAGLDDAMIGVGMSHLEWVDAENERIDAENAEITQAYRVAKAEAADELTSAYRAAVASRQNGWSGAPPGVSYSNGRLPSSALTAIPFAPSHMLHRDAVRSLVAANAAYRAETGRNLSFTDSYRSYSAQVAARAAKPTTTAAPGTSNHGWGMAIDFDYDSARWMAANGADYGWVHPRWARPGGSKPEWWHLEFVAPGVSGTISVDEPELVANVKSLLPETK